MVQTDTRREIVTRDDHAIKRAPRTGDIYTTTMEKRYRMVYDKRLLLDDGIHTVPFGWLGPAPQRTYDVTRDP